MQITITAAAPRQVKRMIYAKEELNLKMVLKILYVTNKRLVTELKIIVKRGKK